MIRAGVSNSFRLEQLEDGLHKAKHVYMMALYRPTATISPATPGYTEEGEVSGDGYQRGGRKLEGRTVRLVSGVACLDFDPLEWPMATIYGARGAMIYNATLPKRNAVCVVDFGKDFTSVAGPMTIQLPAPGATTSLIQWA